MIIRYLEPIFLDIISHFLSAYHNLKLPSLRNKRFREQRAENEVFSVLPARKMASRTIYRPVILCSRTAQKRLLRRLRLTLA